MAVDGAIPAIVETLERQPYGIDNVSAASVLAELSKHGKAHLNFVGI
jgi:hypothetical protein